MESGNSRPRTINLSRLHWPVTALGFGRRVGIWFQGCSIRCAGCCAQDTWDADSSSNVALERVLDWVAARPVDEIDGFTLSGGEPFDQPEALVGLARELRSRYCTRSDRDILTYSGHPWRRLIREHRSILKMLDVVISEPFVRERPGDSLRGSNNQKIHRLTRLARERYGPDYEIQNPNRSMQVHYDGRTLWMIGIPQSGDLERFQEELGKSGIMLGNVSWRP